MTVTEVNKRSLAYNPELYELAEDVLAVLDKPYPHPAGAPHACQRSRDGDSGKGRTA
jgi:hypothetical protein